MGLNSPTSRNHRSAVAGHVPRADAGGQPCGCGSAFPLLTLDCVIEIRPREYVVSPSASINVDQDIGINDHAEYGAWTQHGFFLLKESKLSYIYSLLDYPVKENPSVVSDSHGILAECKRERPLSGGLRHQLCHRIYIDILI